MSNFSSFPMSSLGMHTAMLAVKTRDIKVYTPKLELWSEKTYN